MLDKILRGIFAAAVGMVFGAVGGWFLYLLVLLFTWIFGIDFLPSDFDKAYDAFYFYFFNFLKWGARVGVILGFFIGFFFEEIGEIEEETK